MRHTLLAAALLTGGVALSVASPEAHAQYYEIANQLPNLIAPALSGAGAYKGYVEMHGLAGVGDNRANFIGLSTSQGYQYTPWFFMGAGIGVDVAKAVTEDHGYYPDSSFHPGYWQHNSSETRVMLPIFTDFRFTFPMGQYGFYADIKTGASWILGNHYLRINDAMMSTNAQFFLQPSVGVRMAIDPQHPSRALNLGVTYRLLTANNNYYWNGNSLTLNGLGATIGYEW